MPFCDCFSNLGGVLEGLGGSWPGIGPLKSVLGTSWGVLARLGASWGPFKSILGASWARCGTGLAGPGWPQRWPQRWPPPSPRPPTLTTSGRQRGRGYERGKWSRPRPAPGLQGQGPGPRAECRTKPEKAHTPNGSADFLLYHRPSLTG